MATPEELKALTKPNDAWGICGIVAATAMLVDNGARSFINHSAFHTVLVQIDRWLDELEVGEGKKIKGQIVEFAKGEWATYSDKTKRRGGKAVWGWDDMRNRVKTILQVHDENTQTAASDKNLVLPLTPDALAHFLKHLLKVEVKEVLNAPAVGGAIVGVARDNAKDSKWGKLVHWIYTKGGKYYSWGKEYGSLNQVNPKYKVIWTVKLLYK